MRTLYQTLYSPFCRKVRIALVEKDLPFDMIEEDTWRLRDEFLRINLAGTVPVLVDADDEGAEGPVIVGGGTILEYLDETCDHCPLFCGSAVDRAEIRRLQQWFDEQFYNEVSGPIIFQKIDSRKAGRGAPEIEVVRAALNNMLYHLDYIGYLIDDRKWLAGDELSAADLAAASHLSVLDYLGDVPWHKCEPAKSWYVRLKSRPSFRPILADRLAGIQPSRHYVDLDF